MKKENLIEKTIESLKTIILFYIIKPQNLFIYALTMGLYNIFISMYESINIKDIYKKIDSKIAKYNLIKYTLYIILIITGIFIFLGTISSDMIAGLLNIENTALVFATMSLSTILVPIRKVICQIQKEKTESKIKNISLLLEFILTILISFTIHNSLETNNYNLISLLYIPKILVSIIIILYYFAKKSKERKETIKYPQNNNFKDELINIFSINNSKNICKIIKNSYIYISIIILYIVMLTHFNNNINDIKTSITYAYYLYIIVAEYMEYLIEIFIKSIFKNKDIINKLYQTIKIYLPIIIVFGVVSPLISKIIYNNSIYSKYIIFLNIYSFLLLVIKLIIENISNKKILYISIFSGFILKLLLSIPLINTFHRIGYDVVCGDIISTIISHLTTFIILICYIKKNFQENNYLEKILISLKDNIILCALLIILELLIPIKEKEYTVSLGLLLIYLLISVIYFRAIKGIRKRFKNGNSLRIRT